MNSFSITPDKIRNLAIIAHVDHGKTTLIDSILIAGGPLNSRASNSKVRIIRAEDNGYISRKNYKVSYSNRENKNTTPVVKRNDIVFVETTLLAKFSDNLNTIAGPIRNTISIYALFKLIENWLRK